MTTHPPIQAVVFDYGGVLTTPVADSIRAWLEADGIIADSFTATLKEWLGHDAPPGTPIHRLELGQLTVPEFDELLAGRLRTHTGAPVTPDGVLARLFAAMRPQETMWQLVEELRSAGLRVALLSNSWGGNYPQQRIEATFHPTVISGQVGLRKPDAAIYRLVLDQLGVSSNAAVFIDDAEPNVLGARAVGMHAIHHVSPDATRARLTDMIPDLTNTSDTNTYDTNTSDGVTP